MTLKPKRKILSISSNSLSAEDGNVITTMGVYDCQLPCRNYAIQYKASVLGAVTLSSEFVLRLLKSVKRIDEDDAASFFGFDYRELSFILQELESFGYIKRRNGQVSLSADGEALFSEKSQIPMIFEVEERTAKVGIDSVSLGLEKAAPLSSVQLRFPELPILDPKSASDGIENAKSIFRKNFFELSGSKDTRPQDRPALYSIDSVIATYRFPSSVRVAIGSKRKSPSVVETTLSDWDVIEDMEERVEVLRSAKEFADQLITQRRDTDADAYDVLINTATEFLSEWTRQDGLSKQRYYNECLSRTGEVRSDRETIPVVGNLFVKENLRRLLDQIKYTDIDDNFPDNIVWLAPDVPHWGATTSLSDIVNQLQKVFSPSDDEIEAIGIAPESIEWHLTPAFNRILRRSVKVPSSLEILLIRGQLCSVIVHAPFLPRGLPVPLGFISRDTEVVERTQKILSDFCPSGMFKG